MGGVKVIGDIPRTLPDASAPAFSYFADVARDAVLITLVVRFFLDSHLSAMIHESVDHCMLLAPGASPFSLRFPPHLLRVSLPFALVSHVCLYVSIRRSSSPSQSPRRTACYTATMSTPASSSLRLGLPTWLAPYLSVSR